MKRPKRDLLLKEIDRTVLSAHVMRSLREYGMLYNVDLLLRTVSEIYSIPRFGRQSMRDLQQYLASLGLRLRKTDETVVGRLQNLFGEVWLAPISCLSATSRMGSYGILTLEKAGIRYLVDLERLTPQQIAGHFGPQIHVESALVQNIVEGLSRLGLRSAST